MVRSVFVILLCGTVLPGCAVHELHKDQDLIRTTLLDLYTNQIIDNLVRASNGMPIIHLDYNQAQANVTIMSNIGGSDSQAITSSNVLALPAASLMATRTIMTTLMGNLGAANTNQVAVAATPVTTSNEVYDAYLEYLSLPGSLLVTSEPPPAGAAHLCRKSCGKYYWVPRAYAQQFFRLALLTTAQRGKSLLAPDPYYTVSIQSVERTRVAPSAPDTTIVTLKLDKKIPNDSGSLALTRDKPDGDGQAPATQFDDRYPIMHHRGPRGEDPSSDDLIEVSVNSDNVQAFMNRVKMSPGARVFLEHNQPKQPTTDDLLNRVNFQLQQIQFNQLRQPGS